MSATMRNAVARRPHRERAQPLERKKLGLLEKKKDYQLRAQDFNKKKKQLANLRAKAALRNEDEFYYGMLSRKGPGSRLSRGQGFTGTVDGDRGNKVLDMDTARLLKTQDVAYVRMVRTHLQKEIARLREEIVNMRGIGEDGVAKGGGVRKIVFAEDEEERRGMVGDLEGDEEDEDDNEDIDMEGFDSIDMSAFEDDYQSFADDDEAPVSPETDPSAPLPSKKNKKELETEHKKQEAKAVAEGRLEKKVQKMEGRLRDLEKKLRAMARAEHLMGEQRAKMAKTATSGGVTKKGKKLVVKTRKR